MQNDVPYCFLCTTEDNLSIKARHRDGSVRLMICARCRRQQAKDYNRNRVVGEHKPKRSQVLKDWEVMARKKNSAIARKYAA